MEQSLPYEAPLRTALAAGPAFRIICGRKPLTLEALTEKLASASSEAEMVSSLLAYLDGKFEHGVFLGLTCDTARGRQVIGAGIRSSCFVGGGFVLSTAPQLQRVVQECRLFIGELGEEDGGSLIEAVAGGLARPTLLVPLTVSGQVVAVLCVNDLQPRLAAALLELQRVAVIAGLAFEMLCIRKRIRSG